MKKRIPIFCKIKRHITIPSPSASIFCKHGFRYRSKKLCMNCPLNVKMFDWSDLDVNS